MDDLEREYSPSSRVGGSAAPFVADYELRSEQAMADLADQVRRLDGGSMVVPGHAPSAPLFVFIHGGYWQSLSAASSMYLAPGALARGWAFGAVEYTLAPQAGIDQMVDECRRAVSAIAAAVPMASRVLLAGHSAGAHLAAMVSLVRPAPVAVSRVALVSGVFDLRPLVHTSVNDPLGLDEAAAAALSPALLPPSTSMSSSSAGPWPEVLVAWGDHDTDAFAMQSRHYAAVLRGAGLTAHELECAGRNHFDIVDDLVDPQSALGGWMT